MSLEDVYKWGEEFEKLAHKEHTPKKEQEITEEDGEGSDESYIDHNLNVVVHSVYSDMTDAWENYDVQNVTYKLEDGDNELVVELKYRSSSTDSVLEDTSKIVNLIKTAYGMGRKNPLGSYNDLTITFTSLEEREVDYEELCKEDVSKGIK